MKSVFIFIIIVGITTGLYSCKKNTGSPSNNPNPVDTTTFNPIQEEGFAFPGAEGFGRNATGGRGGKVIEVTNLNDNGPGSLRAAIATAGPRIVVFRVSGRIVLNSTLTINQPNLTIAGQTAPGDGIVITNHTVTINADNIIIRHLRFRLGDEAQVENDAFNGRNRQNIIIDHCSMSWAVDETASFYDNKNFTMQWCIISESLYNSIHNKGQHGYGGIWGGQNASFHHNLISDNSNRNPRFNGSRFSNQPELEVVDFRNNVIYNWGNGNNIYGGEGAKINMVNNYYKLGPSTTSSSAKTRLLHYTGYFYDAGVRPDTVWGGKFYVSGNKLEGNAAITADNWLGVQPSNATPAQMQAAKQSNPFPFGTITTHTADEAFTKVLDSAGATLPKRDPIDARIVNEARTGVETYGGTFGAAKGIIDTQTIFGAWPTYSSTNAPADTDQDGMPDAWEVARKLKPNDPSDGPKYNLSTGYTNVEVYLNSIK